MESQPAYAGGGDGAPPVYSQLELELRHQRPCSRAEITSVGISPGSTSAFAVYSGDQKDQSWIDIFDLEKPRQRGYLKVTGPHAAFGPGPGASSRIATLRDWTVQIGGGVEYHHATTVMVRDYNSGKIAVELKEARSGPVVWSRDGKAIAAIEGRGRMGVWDASTGVRLGRIVSHIDEITHAAFTPDDNLVTLSRDGTLRLSNPRTSKTISRLEIEGSSNSNNPRALAVSQDGKTVVSVWGNTVHLWLPQASHLTSYRLNTVRRTEGWPLCFSPDGRYLACWTEEGFDIMDVVSGSILYERNGGALVTAGAFSADGSVLLLGRMNGGIEVWDISQGKQG